VDFARAIRYVRFMRIPAAAVSILLASAPFAAAQNAPAPRADAVVSRFFGSGWAQADPAAAPAPSEPKAESFLPEGPLQEDHAQVAHMSITRAAYLYYLSRYEGG
jgi:hypothetical protein